MASWTDLIPQFKPYVEQLPVEAMAKVGMIKQEKYEEGVKKIQAQIDSVSGLDIIKDVDKNYLQSKLDELGGGIRGLAAADFSNFQLVNSVTGMTKQITRDKNIQNAIQSTAHYRKELQNIESARKRGKSDKNNEDYFYNDADKWLNDNQVGTVFSDSFSEHTDIMKLIRENVSAAGLDSKYIENVFETDEKGRLKLDKDGHPIPARTMSAETIDTNADKVRAIVANVLSEGNVKNQIRIDGWANTRYTPVETIYKTFENDFNKRDAVNNQRLLSIEALLNSNNLSDEQKQQLIAERDEIKKENENNSKKLQILKQQSINNPDQFKQDYYEDSYINNLLNGFTTVKLKQEIKDSPLTKVLQWEENMNFQRSNENWDRLMDKDASARAWKTIALSEDSNKREWLKFDAEYKLDPVTGQYVKVDTVKKTNPITTETASEIKSENEGSGIDAEASYRNITLDLKNSAQNKGFDLVYTYLNKLNKGVTKDGKPFTKAEALKTINAWARANGETPYQFVVRFAGDIKNKSEKNGVKLSTKDYEAIEEINKLNNDVITRTAVAEDIYRQVKNDTGIDIKDYKLNPQTTIIDGKQTILSVQDQLDIATVMSSAFIISPEQIAAKKRLTEKFGSVIEAEAVMDKIDGENREGVLGGLFDFRVRGLRPLLSKIGKSPDFKKFQTYIGEKFKKVNVVSDNFSATLSGSDEERKAAKGRLAPLFNVSRMDKSEQTKLQEALAEPGSYITYDAYRPTKEGEPWSGKVFLYDTKGNKFSVDVNQANLEAITQREFRPYVENGLEARARISQYGSTNLGAYTTDPNAYQSAAITYNRFTSLQNTDVVANADIEPLSGGKLGLVIYAKDKGMSDFKRIEMTPIKTTVNGKPVYFYDYNELAGTIPRITSGMIKNELAKFKQKK